jgi:hypothetical protein
VAARAVEDLLPWYSSVHRSAGYKSQRSTHAYAGRLSLLEDVTVYRPEGDEAFVAA